MYCFMTLFTAVTLLNRAYKKSRNANLFFGGFTAEILIPKAM